MLPIVKKIPKGSNIIKALLLGIPFSANIGGIATPIGTPPNAIVLGLLSDKGINISFIKWMLAAFPPMLVLIFVLWGILLILFPPKVKKLDLEKILVDDSRTKHHILIYSTICITILLWLTDSIHGIHSSLIALIPMLVFLMARISGKRDFRDISWEILILVGGGISMGIAITSTGLSDYIISFLDLNKFSYLTIALIFGTVTVIMGTFMSHTASANLLVPLSISLFPGNPALIAIVTGICASYGMALPISTPPNAIAYGSELIKIKDMIKAGIIISIIAVLLTVFYEYYLISNFF
ncbi:MAG: DASS family sodium-coupled anion symporter [Pseudomonadota bacterium]